MKKTRKHTGADNASGDVMQDFLNGKRVSELGRDGERRLRESMRGFVGEAQRLVRTVDALRDLIMWSADQMAQLGSQLFGDYSEDPVVRGYMAGEGAAFMRCAGIMSQLVNTETAVSYGEKE